MEQKIDSLYQFLQTLLGLYRNLHDLVRQEKQTLIEANIKAIQEITYSKEALISSIFHAEQERQKLTKELGVNTLQEIIIQIQVTHPKKAELLRSVQQTLNLLMLRVKEQNEENKIFVEKSLEHIGVMKQNILNTTAPSQDTYSQKAKHVSSGGSSRFISKEA